jgi:hypothetical protein
MTAAASLTEEEIELAGCVGADEPLGAGFLIDGSSPHGHHQPNVACAPGSDCLAAEEPNPAPYPRGDLAIRGRFVSPWRTYVPPVLRQY